MSPIFRFFVLDGVGLGMDMEFAHISAGDDSETAVAFIPSVLFAQPGESSLRPYFGAGVGIWSASNGESASGLAVGGRAGVYSFLNEHYALYSELAFLYMSDEERSTNTFGFGVGFAGFVF